MWPGLSPAAITLGPQTGMYPPLITIAPALSRMPTNASGKPGCSRFSHSPSRRAKKPLMNSGSRISSM